MARERAHGAGRARVPPGVLRLRLLAQARPYSALLATVVSLATLVVLLSPSSAHDGAATGSSAGADGAVRFDREREDGALWDFPALDELENRDRLWPPDLGEQTVCGISEPSG